MPCSHPRAGTLWEMRPSATCTATARNTVWDAGAERDNKQGDRQQRDYDLAVERMYDEAGVADLGILVEGRSIVDSMR